MRPGDEAIHVRYGFAVYEIATRRVGAVPGGEGCRRGQRWTWDGVRFEMLHPDDEVLSGKSNDRGCVLRVRPVGVLLMEDEKGVDEKILAVPVDALNPFYKDVKTHKDLPPLLDQFTDSRTLIAHAYRNRASTSKITNTSAIR